ncbi:unnamed protein product [Clonostachys solani]|uniref:Amine oxidase domain-containing protein n=1 Tax=Clonostachys solani TaxID=160281 RepID=A0A9N9VXQ4_9HYPO|nr:unnamed protein product [Clonostachys solani]
MSPPINRATRKRVAIIGSGCSGIAALWALNRTYHDVYLYEAADRLGGHTNTAQWKAGRYTAAVDTGFIVLNTATYPNFLGFLEKLGVETEPAKMKFSVSRDRGVLEWVCGTTLGSVFCQRRNILSPRMWRMLFDIIRFNQFALDLLLEDDSRFGRQRNGSAKYACSTENIGDYLNREGYSAAFRDDYLLPLIGALWSTNPAKSPLDFPAKSLVRFLWNHDLLTSIAERPQWRILKEGSQSYVDAVMRGFPPNHLFLKTAVRHLANDDDGRVRLHLENGKTEVFDHVILATHGDQSLSIINPSATEQERSILSCFQTLQVEAVLHSDPTLMPRRQKAWSSLNYLTLSSPNPRSKLGISKLSLTYDMNLLHHIPKTTFGDVFLTLNPLHQPRRDLTRGRYYYSSPQYTAASIHAQSLLRTIQNKRNITYAGAWTGYGTHEDGFSSGLWVAQEYLGAKLPLEFKNPTDIKERRPKLGLFDHLLRFFILLIQVFVVQILERLVGSRRPIPKPVNGFANSAKLNGKVA